MPRLKPTPEVAAAARFDGLLHAGRMQQGLTVEQMCARAGFSSRTYQKRKSEPELYSVGEIRSLSRIGGIPLRELMAALVPSIEE